MLKAVGMVVLVAALWMFSTGCDQLAASSAAAGVEKYLPAAKYLGNGDMDQLQDRDQLRDGTGANCAGGKIGTLQKRNGTGQGDMLRLRDGSCQP